MFENVKECHDNQQLLHKECIPPVFHFMMIVDHLIKKKITGKIVKNKVQM